VIGTGDFSVSLKTKTSEEKMRPPENIEGEKPWVPTSLTGEKRLNPKKNQNGTQTVAKPYPGVQREERRKGGRRCSC